MPLYRLARRGDDVAPPEKRSVEIKRHDSQEAPDTIRFVATCSPGTYARALARDIGVALGTVAHLDELRRTRNGVFSIDDACRLRMSSLALDSGEPLPRTIFLRDALVGIPELVVDPTAEKHCATAIRARSTRKVPAGGIAVQSDISRGANE